MVQTLGDTTEHFWLMLGMARSVDADLGQAMRDGRLSETEYAAMHTRCRGCAEPGACKMLVDARLTLEEPPAFCRNGRTLEALREAK